MNPELENDETLSNVDDDDMIASDIEDNDSINGDEKLDDSDDENLDDDNTNDDYTIVRKKNYTVMTEEQIKETKNIIVKPEHRITSDCMTIFEYSSVIGIRGTHIANGSIIYTNIENLSDPRDIAKKEIDENKCPLSIVRKLGTSNNIEIWNVNEMIKPNI
jgi:DNA-directed RNA polymerase subunit K/omega